MRVNVYLFIQFNKILMYSKISGLIFYCTFLYSTFCCTYLYNTVNYKMNLFMQVSNTYRQMRMYLLKRNWKITTNTSSSSECVGAGVQNTTRQYSKQFCGGRAECQNRQRAAYGGSDGDGDSDGVVGVSLCDRPTTGRMKQQAVVVALISVCNDNGNSS